MMLTGPEILKRISDGQIKITPFNVNQLNPNSYNLTIGDSLVVYSDAILDAKRSPNTQTISIPTEGLLLHPGRLYLAKTVEVTETNGLVPVLYGRSSAARLGISVNQNAGLGDTGYVGAWTLAINVAQPVKIFAGMKIAQLVYFETTGDVVSYSGKYQGSLDPVPSKLSEDK